MFHKLHNRCLPIFIITIGSCLLFGFLPSACSGSMPRQEVSRNEPIIGSSTDVLAMGFLGLSHIARLWNAPATLDTTTGAQPELVYEYRIAELNRRSPFPYRFHPLVQKYIHIYTCERRLQVQQMLGLSQLYFPLFRELLDKYQLPLELVYLSVVESALNPLAVSKSGAVGLWQFKINTAEMFDLHVDSFVDDRMDPVLATEAACLYLDYLYKVFGNWALALAAYNAGPGAIQRAIQRAGGETDFWKLLPYLPEAAQNYIPAFIAATYIFVYHTEHHLTPDAPPIRYADVDTVQIAEALSFSTISKWTGISLELLHFLNPRYRQGYVPKPRQGSVSILLPKEFIPKFIENSDRIFAQSHKISQSPFPIEKARKIHLQHEVAKGEYLHKLAVLYECTLTELEAWNGGEKLTLHPGDKLNVWVTPDTYARIERIQLASER